MWLSGHGDNRRTAVASVDALLDSIVDTVGAGGTVPLAGFGVFESRLRAACTGHGARTSLAVEVEPREKKEAGRRKDGREAAGPSWWLRPGPANSPSCCRRCRRGRV